MGVVPSKYGKGFRVPLKASLLYFADPPRGDSGFPGLLRWNGLAIHSTREEVLIHHLWLRFAEVAPLLRFTLRIVHPRVPVHVL